MPKHTSHPDIVKRLKRAEGHLRAVIAMFDEEKGCLDLAQQLHAVESAVSNAKREMIHDHINNCLDEPSKAAFRELKEISKYL